MRFKNKEENRVEELEGVYVADGKIFMTTISEDGVRNLQSFDNIAELQKTFEDYKEPEEFWHISCEGKVNRVSYSEYCYYQEKEIGNYFDTKEEAEKAVEKLKAWKRLKDKGFVFNHHEESSVCGQITELWTRANFGIEQVFLNDTIKDDLDLLFGGEE